MSEQFDYVISRLEDAQIEKIKKLRSGTVKTPDILAHENGYLTALDDVVAWAQDYRNSKISKPANEEDEI